jgi:nicotinamide-nucleotide amidase
MSREAILLAIGDEVLAGDVPDTNGAYLTDQLGQRGIRVRERVLLPDARPRIVDALQRAAAEVDWVLTTGGLGPTWDDVTMAAVSDASGRALRSEPEALDRIRGRERERGRSATPEQERMAEIPDGAEALRNDVGAAPGCVVRWSRASVVVLPGVPSEMRTMFERQVAPRLGYTPAIERRGFRVFGLRESEIHTRLRPLVAAGAVDWSIRNLGLENLVKIGADDPDLVSMWGERLQEALAGHVVSTDDATLAEVVGRRLAEQRFTVATAESCTGGGVAQELTAVPGSSRYVLGGVVAYANDVKIEQLGVPAETIQAFGAVSEAVARDMAEQVRHRMGATFGLSTTGIAGPGGGTPDKPVGTVWIGRSGPGGTEATRLSLPGHDRSLVRRMTVQAVLGDLWGALGSH